MRTAVVALVALATLLAIQVACAFADTPLILDHDMLQTLARTGPSKDVRLEYADTMDRILFKTRVSVLVGWADVRLEALFIRDGKNVRLTAHRLTVGGIKQNSARFLEADSKLAKLVNVETATSRVEIYKAGKLVFMQAVP